MKKLIAFYSRPGENYFGGTYRTIPVGNTEQIADMIRDVTGADMFRIDQVEPYARDYATAIDEAKRDLRDKTRPEIVNPPASIGEYDEIYLGYPIYWGAMPMAVYTFLEKYNWDGKTIHPFCTHEGSGLSGTVRQIARECPGAHIGDGLAVHGSEVADARPAVDRWVQ